MKLAKGEKPAEVVRGKIEFELDVKIIKQFEAMEKHTKISKSELASIALKRFISQHKDYLPDDYQE